MNRLRFATAVLLLATTVGADENSDVQPKVMSGYSPLDLVASRAGIIKMWDGMTFHGPRYATLVDGDRTKVVIVVTRENTSDKVINTCGLFSFTAVARYSVSAVPKEIARAMIPADHGCESINISPGEAVNDSLVYWYEPSAQEETGVIYLKCNYYELGYEVKPGTVRSLDMGGILIPFSSHAN